MSKRNDSNSGNITNNKKHKNLKYRKSKDRGGIKSTFEVRPGLPGIILFCDRNKERKCISEASELFHDFAAELYPEVELANSNGEEEEEEEEINDIESEINKEVNELSKGKKKQKYLFGSLKTGIDCMGFMFTKSPVDPQDFVYKLLERISCTGITKTRHLLRVLPVINTCYANLADINSMASKILEPFFRTPNPETGKIEPKKFAIIFKKRNCKELDRTEIISSLASLVGKEHTVDLDNPDLTINVEIFKSICGIGVLKDFNRFKKYNVQSVAQIARQQNDDEKEESDKQHTSKKDEDKVDAKPEEKNSVQQVDSAEKKEE